MKRLCLAGLLLLTACQTPGPAIDGVWSQKRLRTTDDPDFLTDRASRLQTEARALPASEQRQEFSIRWHGAGIDQVKFEYRQVNLPDKVLEQHVTATGQSSHLFTVRGGIVSAWRATLWHGTQLLAEKKSALW